MTRRPAALFLLATFCLSFGASAHHSRPAFFDMSKTVELAGEITRVQWRHPHVRYWIQADAEYGGAVWEMETTPPSLLERYGIGEDVISAGTRVRVAGPPSRMKENVMEVSHVLLPDGREVLLHTGLAPRWSQDTIQRRLTEFDAATIEAAEAAADGIYRVWSRSPSFERPSFWLSSYPVTDAAKAVQAKWDPQVDVDTGCRPKGMPRVMDSAWPFEFVDEGGQIRLLIEEFDLVRIIHMTDAEPEVEPTLLGYSTGRWEDGDLLVRTSHFDAYYFGAAGIRLTTDAVLQERFSLSADERRLDYEMIITDPATFTQPVTQRSAWDWRPGEAVKPYDCIETPGSWSSH